MIKLKSLLFTVLLLISFTTTACDNSQSGIDEYYNGKDKAVFRKWQLLADKGDASAQYDLAWMYANGDGVDKDMGRANYWMKRAYENKDTYMREDAKEFWEKHELWKY